MLDFSNTTLFCLNGVNPNMGVKALRYSMQGIKFKKSIICSPIMPTNLVPDITYAPIPAMDHRLSCEFSFTELYKYIQTDFCLYIHDDGFVINPHLWDNSFFNYDYIGAPWGPEYVDCRVGNGGFCLKSKKLLEISSKIPWRGEHDDGLICVIYKDVFLRNGCRYAPVEVAMKFALETKIDECEYNLDNCFGFHGKGNDPHIFKDGGQQFKNKIALLNTIIDP